MVMVALLNLLAAAMLAFWASPAPLQQHGLVVRMRPQLFESHVAAGVAGRPGRSDASPPRAHGA